MKTSTTEYRNPVTFHESLATGGGGNGQAPQRKIAVRAFSRFIALCAEGWARLYCALSERAAIRLGRILLTPLLLPSERRRRANLRKILVPLGWTPTQCRKASRENRRHFVEIIVQTARMLTMDPHELERRIPIEGEHHLHEALRLGKGVLLIGDHLGNVWEMRALLSVRGFSVACVTFRQRGLESLLERIWTRFRLFPTYVGEGGSSAAAEAFRRNCVFSLSFDSSLPGRRENSMWIRFGPSKILVDSGPARLALAHDVPVVRVHLRPDNALRSRLIIDPPEYPADRPSGPDDVVELLSRWTESLYQEVVQRPSRWWFWGFIDMKET